MLMELVLLYWSAQSHVNTVRQPDRLKMTRPSQRMSLAEMRNVRRLDSYRVTLWELSYLGTMAFIYTQDGAESLPTEDSLQNKQVKNAGYLSGFKLTPKTRSTLPL